MPRSEGSSCCLVARLHPAIHTAVVVTAHSSEPGGSEGHYMVDKDIEGGGQHMWPHCPAQGRGVEVPLMSVKSGITKHVANASLLRAIM